ncbi:MAG: DUF1616 domain-containing protein [Thermoplasmatota archaeon]
MVGEEPLKINIREKPWDLAVVAILTTILLLIIYLVPKSAARTVFGLPYLLFFPGYVLVSFLFPEEEPLDKIERIALSFGLSIAITPLIGLLLNYIWEISLVPLLTSISLFIFVFSALAFYRRRTIPLEEVFHIQFEINKPDWDNYDLIDKALVTGTVILLVASGALAVHIVTTPRTGERFTEFYILGEEGMADEYPNNLTVNETGRITIGATNREHETTDYTLVMGLGYEFEDMASIGTLSDNVTFSGNNTYFESDITLNHTENWNMTVNFSIETAGLYRLKLYLLRDGEVYRDLHYTIVVRDE